MNDIEIAPELWESAKNSFPTVSPVVLLIAIQEFATPPGSMPTTENIEAAGKKFAQEKSTILLTPLLQ